MTDRKRVVVAMSGGVDSSVAAALLVEQGYEVIGMMMRLWSEPGSEASNRCCTPDAMAMARRVASQLNIPFYAIDAQQVFRDTVVQFFMDGYAQGLTPNPCLVCNRHIRWEFLLNHALAIGAEAMATGHYVRLRRGERLSERGKIALLKAVDRNKDQSYVLHVLNQEQLSRALFPLGDYTKSEVRQLARDFRLPVAERSESQDLCFLGKGNYRDFLVRNLKEIENPGPIVDSAGRVLGEHQGLGFYTIGQRKGLGVFASHPMYVTGKDFQRNALIVGAEEDLGQQELSAHHVNWISGEPPEGQPRVMVKIRYRSQEVGAVISACKDQQVHVRFDRPLRDITPGQAAVFFDGEVCLGGGIIQ